MSVLVDIADAVVASLNAEPFAPPFTARRVFVPTETNEELARLHVTVVPRTVTIQPLTRNRSTFECTVQIGVQQAFDVSDLALADAFLDIAEKIIDHLRFRDLPIGIGTNASWLRITHEVPIAAEQLEEQRVATSVIAVVYRVHR